MSNKVVVEVVGSAQQCHLQVSEWRGCLSIVVVWDDETLSLSLQGPAAIVLRQGCSRRHHASHHGCLMKPGKSLTGGGRCGEVSCLCGCSCDVIRGSNITTRCSTTAE